MRPLELTVSIILLAYIVCLLSSARDDSPFLSILPLLAVAALLCQLSVEGYRWQMWPTYFLTFALVAYQLLGRPWLGTTFYYAGICALILDFAAIFFCVSLPIFEIPAPTGPYRVGTITKYFSDDERRDPFADKPNAPRELMVQIWYPVDKSSQGPLAAYRDRRITSAWDARFAIVKSHSLIDVAPSQSIIKYPVLLYMPSWDGIRTESTYLVEDLASHGYVVVGIDHPYSSAITVFPDGRIARRKFSGAEDYSSQSAFEAFVRVADEQVEIRARDATFVLDELQKLNAEGSSDILARRLDLTRVGLLGTSFGGTAAAETCRHDQRCKAGVDLGGMVAGQSAVEGTIDPFMFVFEGPTIFEQTPAAPAESSKRREFEFATQQFARMRASLSKSGGYLIVIDGMTHANFFDLPFYSPLRAGSGDPRHFVRILRKYTLAFFDWRLRGAEIPMPLGSSSLDGGSIHVEAWEVTASK
jgi:predicted dienelactone hydrolase